MFPFFLVFSCCHGNQMQQAKLAQACQAGETRCWFYQQCSLGSAEEPQDRPRVGLDPHPHPVLFTSHANSYQLVTAGGAAASPWFPSSRGQPTPRPILCIGLGESGPASTQGRSQRSGRYLLPSAKYGLKWCPPNTTRDISGHSDLQFFSRHANEKMGLLRLQWKEQASLTRKPREASQERVPSRLRNLGHRGTFHLAPEQSSRLLNCQSTYSQLGPTSTSTA